jgi:hypothetical protein
MSVKDPPRLLDPGGGAPAVMRKFLEPGRADLPNADQLERLARRLPLGGLPGRSERAPSAPPTPAPTAPARLLTAVARALIGLATLGILGLVTGSHDGGDRRNPGSVARGAPPPDIQPQALAMDPSPPAPQALAIAAPQQTAAPPPTSSDGRAAPAGPSLVRARAAAPITAATRSASAADAAETRGGATPAGGAPAAGSESEILLLKQAQDALRADPGLALQLANRHAVRFPSGALAQEREVIAIDALSRLGRREEARARAGAFAERLPNSAHLGRIEALVAGKKLGGDDHKDSPATPLTR